MKYWNYSPILSHSYGLCGLCTTMRTNILLRGNRNHKSTLRYPLYWPNACKLNLRRFLSRQCNTYTIFYIPLPITICHPSSSHTSSVILTRNRVKQPSRPKLKHRQNPISPIFCLQRLIRRNTNNKPTTLFNPISTKPTRRPRKLYPCKPTSNPPTH